MPSEGFGHRGDATGEVGASPGCANASRGRKQDVGMKGKRRRGKNVPVLPSQGVRSGTKPCPPSPRRSQQCGMLPL